jgi:hypothetical protein
LEINVKIYSTEIGRAWTGVIWLQIKLAASCCKHGNKLWAFKRGAKFFYYGSAATSDSQEDFSSMELQTV